MIVRLVMLLLVAASSLPGQDLTEGELAWPQSIDFGSVYTNSVLNIPGSWVQTYTLQGNVLSNNTTITMAGCVFTVGKSNLTVTAMGRYLLPGNKGVHPMAFYQVTSFSNPNVPSSTLISASSIFLNLLTASVTNGFAITNYASPIILSSNTSYVLTCAEGINGNISNGPDQWWSGGVGTGGVGGDANQEGVPCTETADATNYGCMYFSSGGNFCNTPYNHIFIPVTFFYHLGP